MVDRHSELINKAARLYERYRAKGPRPFNVFSVLRNASDEVNLHSRFLHALLETVDPLSGEKENLKGFVRDVIEESDFDMASARIQRESNNIDLLISNRDSAIVIENKIWAGDQEKQLLRYRDVLIEQGYHRASIRLVYLTPYGIQPSEQSVGDIPIDDIQLLSYGVDLLPWLRNCQRRAYDEPGLRESIAQYLRLILAMTNNDYEAEHMDELKNLLIQGDNVVLANQITKSLTDAEAALVERFYTIVDRVLHETIEDLPEVDPKWSKCMRAEEISKCVRGKRGTEDAGLLYRFAEFAWIQIGGNNQLWCGVICSKEEDAQLHNKLTDILASVGRDKPYYSDDLAPWYQWLNEMEWLNEMDLSGWYNTGEWLHIRHPNEQTLKFLSSGDDSLEEYARGLADVVRDLWSTIKQENLLRSA